ncbi:MULTISPECIES: TraB/GumN family protein [unclassified Janthinobacterium]|uniref:TraB/GumN family protein n=1 Tax=unclassified Janthinobacterium TaxID=2610881 RepID=UPI0009DB4D26|nr:MULTISPECIES: TraB/GumN family protein [unclassified Janthinobacterium]MEC5162482.1 uncharacterized protein YbaP (TraB family) [Janthinobacterium sp. CG_S6]
MNIILFLPTLLIVTMCNHSLAEEIPLKNGIIYEIKHNNKISGHLIGVSHILPKELDTPPSTLVAEVISKSDGLFTEIGIIQFITNPKYFLKKFDAAKKGNTIFDAISRNQFTYLENQLTPMFGPDTRKLLEENHPFNIGGALFSLCAAEVQLSTTETELAILAASEDKPIMALETVDEQISSLPPLNTKFWARYLAEISAYVARPDCVKLQEISYKKMAESINNGDLNGLELLINNSYSTLNVKELDKFFISGRNNKFSEKILREINSGKNYVFAVGASHLMGSDGIIKNLESHGITITKK